MIEAIFIGMHHIARANGHAGDFDRHAGADNAVAGVARYRAAREVMKPKFADGGEIADAAIADQADGAEAREDGGHHFAGVRGAITVASDFLDHDHSRFGRRFNGFEQLDERFFGLRSSGVTVPVP